MFQRRVSAAQKHLWRIQPIRWRPPFCLSVAFATDRIARVLDADAAGAGKLAFMLTLTTEIIYIGAYAWMRGALLRRVLPDFPIMLWCAVIAGAMLLFAWLSGFATAPKRNPLPFTTTLAAQVAILGTIMGTFMGLSSARSKRW